MKSKSGGHRVDIVDAKTIVTADNQTLLESLEANDIHIHYQCRDGFCGACRTQLLSGEVTYTTDPLAFIDDNEILPCCCYALGDIKVKVTY